MPGQLRVISMETISSNGSFNMPHPSIKSKSLPISANIWCPYVEASSALVLACFAATLCTTGQHRVPLRRPHLVIAGTDTASVLHENH